MKAMHVIGIWSQIDGEMGTILASILKADVRAGTAMYLSLTSAQAKDAALQAAAKANLKPWQFLLVQAVKKVIKPSRERRNCFAHHIWGSAPEIPGKLLLMPPDVIVEQAANSKDPNPTSNSRISNDNLDISRIMVYSFDDFDDSVTEAQISKMIVIELWFALFAAPEQGRRWLLGRPRIQQALASLSKQSDPLTQRILLLPKEGEPAPEGTH